MRKKILVISAILTFLSTTMFASPTDCGAVLREHIAGNENLTDLTVLSVPHFRNELRREIELAGEDGRLASEQMYTYLDFKYDGETYSVFWKSRTTPAPVGLFANVKYRFVVRLNKGNPKCEIVTIWRGPKLIWNNPRFET